MKTVSSISPLFLVLALLSCQSDDLPVQHPDGYDLITFSVEAEVPKTRTNDYISYDTSIHPSTMGIFGYTNLLDATLSETGTISTENNNPSKTIFNNQQISYSSSQWDYTPKVQWKTYESANSFDFFGYMPQVQNATLTKSGSSVTLAVSFNPFSITAEGIPPSSTDNAFISDTKNNEIKNTEIKDITNAPIICALPDHKGATTSGASFERVVSLKFDQTLTGYEFHFQLDGNMNKIRHFKIKSVSLIGTIPLAGTVTRTYTWNSTTSSWEAGAVKWKDIIYGDYTSSPLKIDNSSTSITLNATNTTNTPEDGYYQWGSTLYMIPDVTFTPEISVKYDVVFTNESGTEVITRNDITSSVLLNKVNFSNLVNGEPGMINPIRILIQPKYLYVLADEDAYTGRLLIE